MSRRALIKRGKIRRIRADTVKLSIYDAYGDLVSAHLTLAHRHGGGKHVIFPEAITARYVELLGPPDFREVMLRQTAIAPALGVIKVNAEPVSVRSVTSSAQSARFSMSLMGN